MEGTSWFSGSGGLQGWRGGLAGWGRMGGGVTEMVIDLLGYYQY
jgi:hypothetical protein